MSTEPLVLAVDDEAGVLRLIKLELTTQGFRVVTAGGANGFQRDETADQRVLRKVHDAHRALAELAHNLVTAELHRALSETLLPRFEGRPIGRQ